MQTNELIMYKWEIDQIRPVFCCYYCAIFVHLCESSCNGRSSGTSPARSMPPGSESDRKCARMQLGQSVSPNCR
eukprot:925381-Pyramimonas_sp.AAC.3